MKILYLPVAMLAVLALQSNLTTALSEEKKILPCTARSSKTGSFYDLTSLSLSLSGDRDKPAKGARTESWRSTGYDYGSNFTLNFCAPVLEKVGNVVGIKESLWQNVSAYYEQAGKIYSIG
jgi:cation-dependent mannose-6-phosphate receptor